MSGSTDRGASPDRPARWALALALTGCLARPPWPRPRPRAPAADGPAQSPLRAQASKSFERADLASDGVRLEATPEGGGRRGRCQIAAKARAEGEALVAAGKPAEALKSLGLAVAAEPTEPANWLAYPRAASLRQRHWHRDYAGRLRQRRNARGRRLPGLPAGERGPPPKRGARGTRRVYAAESEWRPAQDAYRASLALADAAEILRPYEGDPRRARLPHPQLHRGFGSAGPAPSASSSRKGGGRTDFTPFVASRARPTPAVTGSGQQVCVDGPSTASANAFVCAPACPGGRRRAAEIGGLRGLCPRPLPPGALHGPKLRPARTGQAGVPLVSVNAAKLDVEVLRVGDRGLLPACARRSFLSQLHRRHRPHPRDQKGIRVWKGTLDTAKAELNQEA